MEIDEQKVRDEFVPEILDILDDAKVSEEVKAQVKEQVDLIIDKLIESSQLLVGGYSLIQKSQIVVSRLVELINEHHRLAQLPTDLDMKLYHGAASILQVVGWSKDDEE